MSKDVQGTQWLKRWVALLLLPFKRSFYLYTEHGKEQSYHAFHACLSIFWCYAFICLCVSMYKCLFYLQTHGLAKNEISCVKWLLQSWHAPFLKSCLFVARVDCTSCASLAEPNSITELKGLEGILSVSVFWCAVSCIKVVWLS